MLQNSIPAEGGGAPPTLRPPSLLGVLKRQIEVSPMQGA